MVPIGSVLHNKTEIISADTMRITLTFNGKSSTIILKKKGSTEPDEDPEEDAVFNDLKSATADD